MKKDVTKLDDMAMARLAKAMNKPCVPTPALVALLKRR
tara:strand:- start:1633 stop:1746 length:114 start_codon:yes stop_codon:yes gene_type:complete